MRTKVLSGSVEIPGTASVWTAFSQVRSGVRALMFKY